MNRKDTNSLLEIRGLRTAFHTDAGLVHAVNGVDLDVYPAETLAVVGESGCGKSVMALSILRLIATPPGEIIGGRILFQGEDLLAAEESRMRAIRGAEIGMIFQEPMTSLNPVYTVGDQIVESIILHQRLPWHEARERAIEMLRKVGIPGPERRVDDYPHQMSGGMRQRVMIAMALACNPALLIADEPTTALDVTIQAQILDLLRDLQKSFRMSILLITHDLGVVAETAHRVAVMYAGKVLESANTADLFARPRQPYTAGLFHSIPKLTDESRRLQPIRGMVPDALFIPSGCPFHPRCPFAMEICRREMPPLVNYAPTGAPPHWSACWYMQEHPGADLLEETIERVSHSADDERHCQSALEVGQAKIGDKDLPSGQIAILGNWPQALHAIESIFEYAIANEEQQSRRGVVYRIVDEHEAALYHDHELDIAPGYKHSVNSYEIRHIQRQHGNWQTEKMRGQSGVDKSDYALIDEIIRAENLVNVRINQRGQQILLYEKKIGKRYIMAEEVRRKRTELALLSIRTIGGGGEHTGEALPGNRPRL